MTRTRYTMWVGGPEVKPSMHWWITVGGLRLVCTVFKARVSEEDIFDYDMGLLASWLVNRYRHPGGCTAFLPWEEP